MRRLFSAGLITTIVTATGPAQAGGVPLDKEEIREVVQTHLQEVRQCYDEGLARKPTLAGKLTVDFEIVPSGEVSSSQIQQGSTIADAKVESCVAAAVQTWKFPASSDGWVQVSYPFEFVPG
ncbi:AgmX/PglI C-terminal domain-containing protein [Nannocystis bainbridge]|uniref:AgmX/PglI C-terminal domain-containing protein n=1 Tax=Nannocystis bainbridge TaxID=2995303 RepID=A0ABT5DUI0_9BACT|nr:AgmX/PglI C-terminal domain-containing protein [Nannocystis bainbridge]MDC0717281.1 AgmX/PglI C-terminal domain-containing protein [Nannocystis bainbridge]